MSEPTQEHVRRCLWCQNRIGRPSYYVRDEWVPIFSAHHMFGDAQFTDGICPECFAEQTKKLNAI